MNSLRQMIISLTPKAHFYESILQAKFNKKSMLLEPINWGVRILENCWLGEIDTVFGLKIPVSVLISRRIKRGSILNSNLEALSERAIMKIHQITVLLKKWN